MVTVSVTNVLTYNMLKIKVMENVSNPFSFVYTRTSPNTFEEHNLLKTWTLLSKPLNLL